jgi:hypothetical protein
MSAVAEAPLDHASCPVMKLERTLSGAMAPSAEAPQAEAQQQPKRRSREEVPPPQNERLIKAYHRLRSSWQYEATGKVATAAVLSHLKVGRAPGGARLRLPAEAACVHAAPRPALPCPAGGAPHLVAPADHLPTPPPPAHSPLSPGQQDQPRRAGGHQGTRHGAHQVRRGGGACCAALRWRGGGAEGQAGWGDGSGGPAAAAGRTGRGGDGGVGGGRQGGLQCSSARGGCARQSLRPPAAPAAHAEHLPGAHSQLLFTSPRLPPPL